MATVEDIDGEPSVRVSWTAPLARGSDIVEYLIQLETSAAGIYSSTSDCDGSTQTVIDANSCDIPMLTLTADPYNLVQGDPIVAIVKARNSIGWADAFSPANNGLLVPV
jgi:hypothetical protein